MIRTLAIVLAAAISLTAASLPYAGKWKAKAGGNAPAKLIEFIEDGDNGLIIKIASANAVCKAKFDGADYPATGSGVPANYTLAITKTGARSFQMVQKLEGKLLYTTTFSVSDDGNTLTEADSATSSGEPVKVVYERTAE